MHIRDRPCGGRSRSKMAVWTRNGDHVHPAGIPLYSLFQPPASPTDRSSEQRHSPLALQELCSRVVGQAHPFELVQQHHPRVPEELQKRIAFWSFPLNEKQVLEHGCTVMGVSKRDISSVASWDVCDMVQTGQFRWSDSTTLERCALLP